MKSLGVSLMVNPKEFKQKIESVLSQGYKVEFLGKNFDPINKVRKNLELT